MKALTIIAAIIAAVAIAACGSDTTTTVQQAPTVDTVSTVTSQVDDATDAIADTAKEQAASSDGEWPAVLQKEFLKGCGTDAPCICALDSLMEQISTREMIEAGGNVQKEFGPEMQAAVADCYDA